MVPAYPDASASQVLPAEAVRTACIVVNWRGTADTIACLESLALQTDTNLLVVVVDNGSGDDSVVRLRAWMDTRQDAGLDARHSPPQQSSPVRFLLVEAEKNRGFAAGNNLGICAAARWLPDFIWLLNNDTVAPPHTLEWLLRTAGQEPAAGIVGSVLYYQHAPTTIQAWGGGHIRPGIAHASHYVSPHMFGRNDYATFASVLLRGSMLRHTGLLDESFFLYYEDAEFCLRAQRMGFSIAIAFATAVLHREGGSRHGQTSALRTETVTRSGLLLIERHGRIKLLGKLVYLALRVGNRLIRLDVRGAAAVFRGAIHKR